MGNLFGCKDNAQDHYKPLDYETYQSVRREIFLDKAIHGGDCLPSQIDDEISSKDIVYIPDKGVRLIKKRN